MAMISCPGCGQEISDGLELCVYCYRPRGVAIAVVPQVSAYSPTVSAGTSRGLTRPEIHNYGGPIRGVESAAPASRHSAPVVLSLVGAGLLFIGPFAPLVSVPILGTMNYFANGKGDGTVLVAIAVVSLIGTALRWVKVQWVLGLAALGLITFFVANVSSKIADLQRSAQADLAGNPFGGLATGFLQGVQVQWGAAVIALGGMMLIAASIAEYRSHS